MRVKRLSDKARNQISALLVIVGVMLMLYPLFTDVYAGYSQRRLLAAAGGAEISESPAIENQDPHPVIPAAGFKDTILAIPVLELKAAVVKGTGSKALRSGPGWYEESALPGAGNTAIAAHRTMYGGWFRRLDRLTAGGVIVLTCDGRVYKYAVTDVFVVDANDWSVIEPTEEPVLTLTTCHPVGSVRQRLVVRAALTGDRAEDAGRHEMQ